MTEVSGRLATTIVQRYRDRFGRGPTEAKAYVGFDYALVILGRAQTDVERSLVAEGELEWWNSCAAECARWAPRNFAQRPKRSSAGRSWPCSATTTLSRNTYVMVFLLEPERGEAT
jgi:hypothetical protein